ncbi:hypothetical protein GCK32_004756 [Trichostrongylus colubriformis]|uniref:Uncharacterized protein n=1 Tax=Trichostrongylus colubriformis TaxID=6319 RepID=A0AAN8F644_TRICO
MARKDIGAIGTACKRTKTPTSLTSDKNESS